MKDIIYLFIQIINYQDIKNTEVGGNEMECSLQGELQWNVEINKIH